MKLPYREALRAVQAVSGSVRLTAMNLPNGFVERLRLQGGELHFKTERTPHEWNDGKDQRVPSSGILFVLFIAIFFYH